MSRQVVAVFLAAATLLIAAPAWAQRGVSAPNGSAFQIGLRLGYAAPFGKTGRTATDTTDDDLSSSISGQIPIGVDFGYLFNPNVYVGASFMYGFGFVGSSGDQVCNQSGVSCSTSDINLGVNAQYHLNPGAGFDPWIGIGLGYEWVNFSATVGGQSASVTGSGLEYVKIQFGGDVAVAPNFAAGPFVSFSAGQYGSTDQSNGGTTVSQDITNKSFHEWLMFGVRGVYNIGL